MKARLNRKGFSLLEMIAVITLIGIVAAVTLYRLNGVNQNTARNNVANENVALIQAAVERYYFENGSFPTDVGTLVPTYLPSNPKAPHPSGSYSISSGIVSYDPGT